MSVDDEDTPRRYLITVTVSKYKYDSSLDRAGLAEDRIRIVEFFSVFGYEEAFTLASPTREEFVGALREFCLDPARRPQDYFVIYLAAHGAVPETGSTKDDLALLMADARPGDLLRGTIRASNIGDLLLDGTRLLRVLLIVDACFSGNAMPGLARSVSGYPVVRAEPGVQDYGFGLLSSALASQFATEGLFTRSLRRALETLIERTGSAAGVGLAAVLKEARGQLPHTQQPSFEMLRGNTVVPPFLGEADATDEIGWMPAAQRKRRAADMIDRFTVHVAEFVGRGDARGMIVEWLANPGSSRTVIVTADPGSGKTALLGWLASASDPRYATLAAPDAEPRPPLDAIDIAIYAGGLTARHILAGIAAGADITGIDFADALDSTVSALLEKLQGRGLVVLIDGIDEAFQAPDLTDEVLIPLIRDGAGAIRLLLGARRDVFERLRLEESNLRKIDLDSDYKDDASLQKTVRKRLAEGTATAAPSATLVSDISTAIATEARHSFFLARLLVDNVLSGPTLPDPKDKAWLESLSGGAGEAMHRNLISRLGGDTSRAMGLLLPLAYAQGDGLPWAGVWPVLAEALTPGGEYPHANPVGLRADVASYVVEVIDADGTQVFRLCHQALADYLLKHREGVLDQRLIVSALIGTIPRSDDARPDWPQAHPYVRAHLVAHAMLSGDIDRLAADPGFLLISDPSLLLPAFDETASLPARAAADAYRLALPALRGHSVGEHPAYLGLAARYVRAGELADRIDTAKPWRARWAVWQPFRPHLRIDAHSPVNAVAYANDRKRPVVVSGGDDGRVYVWDAQTGGPVREPLNGHDDAVTALAITQRNGRQLVVSGSVDGTVLVRDLATGEQVGQPFRARGLGVRAVAVVQLGESQVVISGGDDGMVHFSDLEGGQPVGMPFSGHKSMVTALAAGRVDGQPLVVSADQKGNLLFWDPSSDEVRTRPQVHPRVIRSVALTEIGGRPVVLSGCDDTRIHVWDVETGKSVGDQFVVDSAVYAVATGEIGGRPVVLSGAEDGIRMFDMVSRESIGDTIVAHSGRVRALAFAPIDGRPTLMSGGTDESIRIWDVGATTDIVTPFTGHRQGVNCLAVVEVDDRPTLISGGKDATVRVWDLATGRPVGAHVISSGTAVTAVASCLLNGCRVIVSGGLDGTVRVWDFEKGHPNGNPYTGHSKAVTALAVATLDGKPVVISASRDQTVHVWSLTTRGRIGPTFESHRAGVRALAVTVLDGATVVVSSGDDRRVWVWNVQTRAIVGLRPFDKHTSNVTALAVVEQDDGSIVVSGDEGGAIRAWDLRSRAEYEPPFPGHSKSVLALAVTRVGRRTAVVSASSDATARMWDLTTRRPTGAGPIRHSDWVRALAVSEPAGVSTAISGAGDGTIKVWDVDTGVEPFGHHAHWVRAVAVGRLGNRRIVVSGSVDTVLRVWDLADGRPIGRPIAGHTHGIRAVAVTTLPDNRTIAVSGGDDDSVRIWDLESGIQLASIPGHTDWVRTLAIAAGRPGGFVVSGGDTTVRVWRLLDGAPAGSYTGHEGWIRAVEAAELGGRSVVISASADTTVHVWDLENHRRIGPQFTGHSHPVRDVAVTRLSGVPIVISSSDNGTVRAWDLRTRDEIAPALRTEVWNTGALVATSPALRGATTVRVVTAVGDRVSVHELSVTSGWETTTTIDIGSDVLGVALSDRDFLVLGGKLGIVGLELPG